MKTIPDYFGKLAFDDRAMRAALPANVYSSLKKTIEEGCELDLSVGERGSFSHERLGCGPTGQHITPIGFSL